MPTLSTVRLWITDRRAELAQHLCGLALVLAALGLGGAHPEVNLALLPLLVAALGLAWSSKHGSHAGLVAGALALALLATLVQLVPLPMAAVRVLSPELAAVTQAADPSAGWLPLSVEPPATAHEVLKLVLLLCAALLAPRAFGKSARRLVLLRWIGASGTLVVLVGLAQALMQVKQPYGAFGRPLDVFVATFINPNHLAGFLGLTAFAAAGVALETGAAERRWLWLAGAALCGAGVFLSLSRGGILAFVLAALFFAGALALRRAGGGARRVVAVQAMLGAALLVAGYLAYSQIVRELWTLGSPSALSKTQIWTVVPAALRDFFWLGGGRGAFASVASHYIDPLPWVTFSHLENEALQAVVDWGPLVGVTVLGLFAWAFVRVLARAEGRAGHLAAASALLFLAVQNQGDFNLAVTAVALPAALLLAAFGHRAREAHHDAHEGEKRTPRRLLAAGALVVLAVLGASAGWYAREHAMSADTARVKSVLAAGLAPEVRQAELAAIMRHHPLDYVLPLFAAQHELRERDGARRALSWLNRAMRAAPASPAAHRLAGTALWRLGAHSQALLELRLACRAEPPSCHAIAEDVWRLRKKPEDVLALTKDAPEASRIVAEVLLRHGGPTYALEILKSSPEDGRTLELRARARLALGQHAEAATELERLEQREPSLATAYLLQAQALTKRKDFPAALAVLDRGLERAGDPRGLLYEKAALLSRTGELGAARELAARLLERSSGADAALAHHLLGRITEQGGRLAYAVRHYEQARDASPASLHYRLEIARARERLGDLQGARAELERARAALGSTPALEERLAQLGRASERKEERLREKLWLEGGP